MLHCVHSRTNSDEKNVVVRSPSGDVNVTVLMLNKLDNYQDRVFLDYGTGNQRKRLWLCNTELSNAEKECLIGVHAFTGNDYISFFVRKGKRACFKIIEKNPKFIEVFASLGSSWSPQDEDYDGLE